MEAAYFGRLEIMRMLISAGANVNYVNASGEAAVHRALQKGRDMAFNLLIDAGLNLPSYKFEELKSSLIFQAIAGGSSQAIYSLIDKGFDLSARREGGDTPLTYAVTMHSPRKVVETLLSLGADPCVADSSGKLPEQWLSENDEYRKEYGHVLDGACRLFKERTKK